MNNIFDSVVIGAGPAGITAAIYLKRANLNCCIVDKSMPGGQINKTSTIENYPGFIEISGPDFAEKLFEQINNLDIHQIYKEVVEIKNFDKLKEIKFNDGEIIKTRSIILAVGRTPKKLDKNSFRNLEGKGISFCSLCDGNLYKNCDVSIVGAGNSALEESLYLADICKTVTIINRSDSLKGDAILIEKVKNKKNIEVLNNSVIEDFVDKDGVLDAVNILKDGDNFRLETKACFIFIGYTPDTDFLKSLDILDEKGYIIVDAEKKTSISGIYAAGDVVKKEAYQIVTATSDGALAAISCVKDMKEERI